MIEFSTKDSESAPDSWLGSIVSEQLPIGDQSLISGQLWIRDISFYCFVAYLAQLVFFGVLGMGWAWGEAQGHVLGRDHNKFSPHLTIGASALHLKAGQTVLVHYDVTLRSGCLSLYLGKFPFGPVTAHEIPDIVSSGSGDLVVPVSQDGWQSLNFFPTGICRGPKSGVLQTSAPDKSNRYNLSYKLSWRVGSAR